MKIFQEFINYKIGDIVDFFGDSHYKMSIWENLWVNCVGWWMNTKQFVRDFIFYLKHGFYPVESWDFYTQLCKWALPRIKHLQKTKQGFPHTLTEEEWDTVMSKIVWSVENVETDVWPIKPSDYDNRMQIVDIRNGSPVYKGIDDRPWDFTPVEEHQKKLKEGFDLLGKHFTNLWD